MLFCLWNMFCTLTLALSIVCVQCKIWLSSLSSSLPPLCRVLLHIFLRQTMSLGNTVCQPSWSKPYHKVTFVLWFLYGWQWSICITCLADGVMPCCTTMMARWIFSSCILWQYVLMVLIPIFGSSGKKTNIWSEKHKCLLLIQPYLLSVTKVACLLNCCVHIYVPIRGLLSRFSSNFIPNTQKTCLSNLVFTVIGKKNRNYMW